VRSSSLPRFSLRESADVALVVSLKHDQLRVVICPSSIRERTRIVT